MMMGVGMNQVFIKIQQKEENSEFSFCYVFWTRHAIPSHPLKSQSCHLILIMAHYASNPNHQNILDFSV